MSGRGARTGARIAVAALAGVAFLVQVGRVGALSVANVWRVAPSPVRTSLLSAWQLAGQRVIFSYRGLVPPPALMAEIKAGEAAGVVFFGGNIRARGRSRG